MKTTAAGGNSRELTLRQRRSQPRIPASALRLLLRQFLTRHLRLQSFDLGIQVVGDAEITRLNQTFLHHEGVTDVITFDYLGENEALELHGEVFVCVSEAVRQAHRFHTTWLDELVRYMIHGILHLRGYDDQSPRERRRMKTAENRWLRRLRSEFPPSEPPLPHHHP